MSDQAPQQAERDRVSKARIQGNLLRWMPLAVVVAGLDQATKAWVTSLLVHGERIQVLPFFAWVRWHNEGAAFSFLASAGGWQRWFFIVLALFFSVYIVWEIARLSDRERNLGWVYGLYWIQNHEVVSTSCSVRFNHYMMSENIVCMYVVIVHIL